MQKSDFRGVFPAITTKMTEDEEVDFDGVADDVEFQIAAGVDGIIACGSLGEASTLVEDEKLGVARTAIEASGGRTPVLLTIAEDSTRAAARLAAEAERMGADGLMVLPIIIYNNPIAYGIDVSGAMLAEMADEPRFVAVKESTGDTRRINETLRAVGDRYQLLTGVDDLALESLVLGCSGWIAGLVNAFPHETVAIYRLAAAGRIGEALEIYRWFLPLLHMDIGPRFVQNIKLVEHLVRGTSPVTRAPRLRLSLAEAARVRAVTEEALRNRPDLARYGVL